MPVRSLNFGATGNARLFVPFQSGPRSLNLNPPLSSYNYATDSTIWSTRRGVQVASGYFAAGDPWSTSSNRNQLDYVSNVFVETATNQACVGVAATTWAGLTTGSWSYPMACANPKHGNFSIGRFDDGPAIHYDPGGTDLYVVSADTDPRGGCADGASTCVRLYIFRNCNQGQPGSSQCPLTSTIGLRNFPSTGHPTVRTNTATHNVMVAYKDVQNNVRIAFYTPSGVFVNEIVVGGGPYDAKEGSDCTAGNCHVPAGDPVVPKCGPNADGSGGCSTTDCGNGLVNNMKCMRLTDKVQFATKYVGTTYAYLTYMSTCAANGPDAKKHMKQHLRILNVTFETAWQDLGGYTSGSCTTTTENDFAGTVVSSSIANANGWAYYKQVGGNPCNTALHVVTSTSPTWATLTGDTNVDSFGPTVLGLSTTGLADYIGSSETASSANPLFFAYGRPVQMTGPDPTNCVPCKSKQYSVALYGVRVTP